ncbi:unnamed protein product, partial [Clonostachys rosea f. rosea IK726]
SLGGCGLIRSSRCNRVLQGAAPVLRAVDCAKLAAITLESVLRGLLVPISNFFLELAPLLSIPVCEFSDAASKPLSSEWDSLYSRVSTMMESRLFYPCYGLEMLTLYLVTDGCA